MEIGYFIISLIMCVVCIYFRVVRKVKAFVFSFFAVVFGIGAIVLFVNLLL